MRSSLLIALILGIFSTLLPPTAVRAEALPDRVLIRGVAGHAQSFSLSCEARSAVDWAAFWDVGIREQKFLAKLPRSDNPDEGFVGRPTDAWGNIPPSSYGVHAEPVAALLREYGLQAEAHRSMKWSELEAEIAAGRPVIVWVIGQVWRGKPVRYKASDGHKTTVAPFEHTMIVVGYGPTVVELVDAYTGETQTHSLGDFLASWKTLGNMAVTGQSIPKDSADEFTEATIQVYIPAILNGAAPVAEAPPSPAQADVYIVQQGDSLVGVARRLNVNWRRLANLNHITPPFHVFPGQKLKLP
jgi:uncharacterized protein YvpB